MTEIRFISRGMLPPEFMQGLSSKEDYLSSSLKILEENFNPKADFPPIRILGLCLIFGNSPLYLWVWVRLWLFTRQGLTAILRIAISKRKMAPKSGLSLVMAKLMNQNH